MPTSVREFIGLNKWWVAFEEIHTQIVELRKIIGECFKRRFLFEFVGLELNLNYIFQ